MQIGPGSAPYVFLILDDNTIQMIDFVNEANKTVLKTIHDEVRYMRVCPNGRYVLSGGDKGDIILYSVRRQPNPEAEALARAAFGNGTSVSSGGSRATSG